MRVPEPFRREGDHLAIDLPGARVLYTTRRGGVSTGPYESLNLGWRTGDDRARVEANRERVAEIVGIPRERFAQGRQEHGTTVRRRSQPPDPAETPPAPADGQATDQANVAPVVLVADCLPVALAAPGAVAMLHCGWRGLAAGIVAEGVAALRELGANAEIAAAIGPGAGRCCYAVGEEVHAAFADLGPDVREGRNLDLKLVARRRLEAAGVRAVHDAELCTMCSEPGLFFSHRRDAGVTGRCCYAVGDEVHAAFADLGPDVREGRNLDLKLVARRRLEAAGVRAVHDAELCTMCSEPGLFFSHRRDAGVTGRQAGVAWRS